MCKWQASFVLCSFFWSMMTCSEDVRLTPPVKSSIDFSYIVHISVTGASSQIEAWPGIISYPSVKKNPNPKRHCWRCWCASSYMTYLVRIASIIVVKHDIADADGTRNSLDGRKNAMCNAWLQWLRGCNGAMAPYAPEMAVWLHGCVSAWLQWSGCVAAWLHGCNALSLPKHCLGVVLLRRFGHTPWYIKLCPSLSVSRSLLYSIRTWWRGWG